MSTSLPAESPSGGEGTTTLPAESPRTPIDQITDVEELSKRLNFDEFLPDDEKSTAPKKGDDDAETESTEGHDTEGQEGEEPGDGDAVEEVPEETPASDADKKSEKAPRALMTPFALIDKETGEAADFDPDAQLITWKQGGKEIKLPLDHVVRLAKHGHHNERLQDRNDTLEEELLEYTDKVVPNMQAFTKQVQEYIEKLFSSEEFREQQLKDWEEQQTPEAQLKRAREENALLRSGGKKNGEQPADDGGTKYRDEQLVPAIQTALSPYGKFVTVQEAADRLAKLTKHLMDPATGKLRPDKRDRVLDIVDERLAPWIASLADTRALAAPEGATKKGEKKPAGNPGSIPTPAERVKARTQQARVFAKKPSSSVSTGGTRPGTQPARRLAATADASIASIVARSVADISD